jgi:hypothetical protein
VWKYFRQPFYRLDIDLDLLKCRYTYYQFCKDRAPASIEIDQFILNSPDQNKSLIENLTDSLFNGKDSTAIIGGKYNVPVRVFHKDTRDPISDEFYYLAIEHLTPRK